MYKAIEIFACVSVYTESDFVLRMPRSYDYHCSLLSGPLAEADLVTYGVNYESALNKQDFHVGNNQLPQDISIYCWKALSLTR